MEQVLSNVFLVVGIYFLVGLIFAGPFLFKGAGKIDPVAQEGSWGFRIMIFPGVLVFWPLLLKRWISGVVEPPPECTAHRRAAGGCGCVPDAGDEK